MYGDLAALVLNISTVKQFFLKFMYLNIVYRRPYNISYSEEIRGNNRKKVWNVKASFSVRNYYSIETCERDHEPLRLEL